VLDWTLENLSADDVARLRAIYEPLTESVRELIDATIRTEVDAPNSTPPRRASSPGADGCSRSLGQLTA
jgi:hypothetical protein